MEQLQERSPKYRWAIALGLFALALALRLYRLGQWSFWVDEISTVERLKQLIETGWVQSDWIKPSLILNALSVRLFGEREWSARIVSAFLGAALVSLLYLCTSDMMGRRTGTIAAAMLAISPWHIYLSQNARYYASLILLAFLASIFFHRAVTRQSKGAYLLAGLCFALAFLERPFVATVLPGFIGFVFYRNISDPRYSRPSERKHLFTVYLVILVGLLLGGSIVIWTLRRLGGSMSKLYWVVFEMASHMRPTWVLTKGASDLGLPIVVIGSAGMLLPNLRKNSFYILAIFLALSGFLSCLFLSFFSQVYTRYMMHTLVYWCIMAAATVDEMISHRRLGLVLGLLSIPALLYDKMWLDLAYYTGVDRWTPRIIVVCCMILSLLAWLVLSMRDNRLELRPRRWRETLHWVYERDVVAVPVTLLVIAYMVAQPIVVDYLHFHQAGHRLDWRPVIGILRERMGEHDLILTGMWPVASYYLDRPVVDVKSVTPEQLEPIDLPIWIIADYGAERDMTPALKQWAEEHCSQVVADGYMYRGQWWSIKLLECSACSQAQTGR